jgi:outer membrane receptor protein involved in Fe transport
VILAFPPAPFATGIESAEEDQRAYSLFGQLMWDATERLEISGGVRYSKEEKDLKVAYAGTDVTDNLADDSLSFENVSPEFTVSYDLSENMMVFASYKRGFKSGGFDAGFSNGGILRPGFENTYDEEEVSGFEGGFKAIFDKRLVVNLTAYAYDYDDLQVSNFDADTITFKVRNAAGASVRGIEADVSWATPFDGLSLSGTLAYNDAEFEEFRSPCYTGQTPAAGCNLTANPANGAFLEQDLSGRRLPNAPELVGNAGIKYFRMLDNGLSLDFALNALYSDEYTANPTQSPQDLQEDYVKLNASVRLFGLNDRWQLSLTGRNLTNEYTFSRSGPVTFTGGGTGTDAGFLGDRSGVISRGREFFLDFIYRPQLGN